jgi:hypothetical protein
MANDADSRYTYGQIALGGMLGNPLAAIFMVAMNMQLSMKLKVFFGLFVCALFILINFQFEGIDDGAAAFGYVISIAAAMFCNFLITRNLESVSSRGWLAVLVVIMSAQAVALLIFLS